jgi:hypothetical protein
MGTKCTKMHNVDCIWFKSLDCGGTLALLNTHTVLPVTNMLSALHTAKQTRSNSYHCSTPTAFMTHTVPAITLSLNNYNKQKEKENTFPCKVCLYKWKLKPQALSHLNVFWWYDDFVMDKKTLKMTPAVAGLPSVPMTMSRRFLNFSFKTVTFH